MYFLYQSLLLLTLTYCGNGRLEPPIPEHDKATCGDDNGRCSQRCVDHPPGHHCECDAPAELAIDGRTCIDPIYYTCISKQNNKVTTVPCLYYDYMMARQPTLGCCLDKHGASNHLKCAIFGAICTKKNSTYFIGRPTSQLETVSSISDINRQTHTRVSTSTRRIEHSTAAIREKTTRSNITEEGLTVPIEVVGGLLGALALLVLVGWLCYKKSRHTSNRDQDTANCEDKADTPGRDIVSPLLAPHNQQRNSNNCPQLSALEVTVRAHVHGPGSGVHQPTGSSYPLLQSSHYPMSSDRELHQHPPLSVLPSYRAVMLQQEMDEEAPP